jgi:hypothetical protein
MLVIDRFQLERVIGGATVEVEVDAGPGAKVTVTGDKQIKYTRKVAGKAIKSAMIGAGEKDGDELGNKLGGDPDDDEA